MDAFEIIVVVFGALFLAIVVIGIGQLESRLDRISERVSRLESLVERHGRRLNGAEDHFFRICAKIRERVDRDFMATNRINIGTAMGFVRPATPSTCNPFITYPATTVPDKESPKC